MKPLVVLTEDDGIMGVLDYLHRRSRSKLYQQWVVRDGLSPEEIPNDLQEGGKERLYKRSAHEFGLSSEDAQYDEIPEFTHRPGVDNVLLRLSVRYIFLGAVLITSLLVILAIVLTILIMRSC